MFKFIKRFFWVFFFLLLLNVGVSVWVLVHDLQTRFPNLDFSKAQFGVSSWYSKTDKGIKERTANNEIFDDRKMTCATWDYPFGKRLLVINAMTGKWVVCRVNDRGPHKRLGRKIDLTKAAFRRIANPKLGLAYVSIIATDSKKKK